MLKVKRRSGSCSTGARLPPTWVTPQPVTQPVPPTSWLESWQADLARLWGFRESLIDPFSARKLPLIRPFHAWKHPVLMP